MKYISLVCIAVMASHILHGNAQTKAQTTVPTVNTSSGPVEGHIALNTTNVSEYLGIPFAKPPLGDLRFAPPEAYNGTSTINGTNFVSTLDVYCISRI
jgi:cholinesterase